MGASRRDTLRSMMFGSLALVTSLDATGGQDATQSGLGDNQRLPRTPPEDERLPNGKSQRDEIARQQHADALKDVETLVTAAQELREELKRAGNFVVPVTSVRKTEEIEKLAKRIRGRLKN